MTKLSSMENATIVINMVIELMNAKKNLNLKGNVINERCMGINPLNLKVFLSKFKLKSWQNFYIIL